MNTPLGAQTHLCELRFEKETIEVTESDGQPKRSKTDVSELVNELVHLGAAIGPDFVTGAKLENWQKLEKSRWRDN